MSGLSSLAAGSQVAYRGDGEGEGKRGLFFSRTNLDDAQLETLVARKNQYEADTAADRAHMQVHYRKLFFLLSKPGVDRKDVLAEQEKISELKARLFKTRITYFMDAWAILNEEQRQKMRRMVLERQLSNRSWKGRGHALGSGSNYRSSSNSSDSSKGESLHLHLLRHLHPPLQPRVFLLALCRPPPKISSDAGSRRGLI
ncbi:MAG: periplasmic heavy metal sensor [Cyanobacteriota/Melainabacteria group bacterium]